MKIVRKLLRLLPFLMLSLYIVYGLLFINLGVNTNLASSMSSIQDIFKQPIVFITNLIDNFHQGFGGSFVFFKYFMSSISRLFTGVDFQTLLQSNRFILSFLIFTLSYELFLSMLFLFFDVFNFMFSIGSNWLRKGENLND